MPDSDSCRYAVMSGDLLARRAVGVGGHDPKRERAERQQREDEEGEQRELEIEHHQDHHRPDQHQGRAEQRRHAVGDELVERLHVVGEPRDDHAGLAARVEPDRERLQVREELDPQVLQHPLADPADEVRLDVGGAPVDEGADQEREDDEGERREVARHDPLVDRELGQRRRRERRGRAREQRGEHEARAPAIRAQQRQQPAQLATTAAGRAPAAHDLVAPRAGPGAVRFTRRAHSPATASRGLRVRNTWSGRPFSAISA